MWSWTSRLMVSMEFLERRFHRVETLDCLVGRHIRVVDAAGKQRRFNSEPRMISQSHDIQQDLPIDGHQVARTNRFTSYLPRERPLPAPAASNRRQQSLPARKPGSDITDPARDVSSAPDKDDVQGQRQIRPPVKVESFQSRSRAANHDIGPELPRRTHGISTRAHDQNYHRSTKFATSWAEVRAENLALRDGSPGKDMLTQRIRESVQRSRRGPSNCETVFDLSPRKQLDYSRSAPSPQRKQGMARGRAAHRRNRKAQCGPQSLNGRESHNMDNSKLLSGGETEDSSNDEEEEERRQNADDENTKNANDVNKTAKRPKWNDSVNVTVDSKPPPKLSSKRYEKELTFKPTLTTKQEVTMAYTGRDSLGRLDRDLFVSDEDEMYESPYYDSDAWPSSDSSPNRSKERVLNKREAEMFIKMSAVYGSDAYKNQRKEWFLQKLAKVQEQQAKLEEEKKRQQRKKREEDELKQQDQLEYVRNKFRKRQHHRFRTQYVTSRVLEHEQANRHEYGLPEDYDAGQLGDGSKLQNTNGTRDPVLSHGESTNKQNGVTKSTLSSPVEKALGKRYRKLKQPNSLGPEPEHKEKLLQEKKARAWEKEQERQKEWYKDEANSTSPQASRTTSGYHSPHTDDDQCPENTEQRTNTTSSDTLPRGRVHGKQFKHENTRPGNYYNDNKDIVNDIQADGTGQKNNKNNTENQAGKSIYAEELKRNKPDDNVIVNTNNNNNKLAKYRQRRVKQKGRSDRGGSYPVKSSTATDVNIKTLPVKKKDDTSRDMNQMSQGDISSQDIKYSVKTPSCRKTEEEDEILVYTGHFRQERDEYYHDSEELPKAYQKKDAGVVKKTQPSQEGTAPSTDNVSSGLADGYTMSGSNRPDSDKKHNIGTQKHTSSKQLDPNKHYSNDSCPSNNKSREKKLSESDSGKTIFHGAKSKSQPKTIVAQSIQIETENESSESGAQNETVAKEKLPRIVTNDEKDTEAAVADSVKSKAGFGSGTKSRHPSKTESIAVSNITPSAFVKTSLPQSPSSTPANLLPAIRVDQSRINKSKTDKKDIGRSHRRHLSNPNEAIQQSNDHVQGTGRAKEEEILPVNHSSKRPRDGKGGQVGGSKDARTKVAGPEKQRDPALKEPRVKTALAAKMFDVKAGPTWDPHAKIPKMEGIDTLVIERTDGKGRVVKRKKNVKDVVKEADQLLKVPETKNQSTGQLLSPHGNNRVASPTLTLGSDFDVNDDDDETEDIFERLRKKYSIKIDSDEGDE